MENKKFVSASFGKKCRSVFSFCDSSIAKTLEFYVDILVSPRHVPP